MCRLAAFPPNFPRIEALQILAEFEKTNTDGTGSVYVRDGEFMVDRWPEPFSKVIRREPFLGHMPYNGWTLAHLRAASNGAPLKRNTHPFVVGQWAVIHNGVWTDHNLVRLALSRTVKMKGDTDSEVAAHLWEIIGPRKFAEAMNFNGVFLGLKKDGHLWVAKTSGDLEMKALKKDRTLIASELDARKYDERIDALYGWYHFDENGLHVAHKETRTSFKYGSYGASFNQGQYFGCQSTGTAKTSYGGRSIGVTTPSTSPDWHPYYSGRGCE